MAHRIIISLTRIEPSADNFTLRIQYDRTNWNISLLRSFRSKIKR
jgi:hypothetical protein